MDHIMFVIITQMQLECFCGWTGAVFMIMIALYVDRLCLSKNAQLYTSKLVVSGIKNNLVHLEYTFW